MNLIKAKKIATAIVSGALATMAFAPGVFAQTVDVVDNGAFSKNHVVVKSTCVSGVYQNNTTSAVTTINATSNSGGNSSSFNTGGDSGVVAGESTTAVGVLVMGGDNTATAPDCCECANPTDVTVKENGVFSHNGVYTETTNVTTVGQSSKTWAYTNVSANSNSGGNKSSFNTGKWGTSKVKTGASKTYVGVGVVGGNNTVTP